MLKKIPFIFTRSNESRHLLHHLVPYKQTHTHTHNSSRNTDNGTGMSSLSCPGHGSFIVHKACIRRDIPCGLPCSWTRYSRHCNRRTICLVLLKLLTDLQVRLFLQLNQLRPILESAIYDNLIVNWSYLHKKANLDHIYTYGVSRFVRA